MACWSQRDVFDVARLRRTVGAGLSPGCCAAAASAPTVTLARPLPSGRRNPPPGEDPRVGPVQRRLGVHGPRDGEVPLGPALPPLITMPPRTVRFAPRPDRPERQTAFPRTMRALLAPPDLAQRERGRRAFAQDHVLRRRSTPRSSPSARSAPARRPARRRERSSRPGSASTAARNGGLGTAGGGALGVLLGGSVSGGGSDGSGGVGWSILVSR